MSAYLVDTNVISELRKGGRADPGVAAWMGARNPVELFLSTVTLAEISKGIGLVAKRDPAQASRLAEWYSALKTGYGRAGHLLPFRTDEAEAWGSLNVLRPLPILDGMLAATALVHGLVLVTRNVTDFAGLPIRVFNPFSTPA